MKNVRRLALTVCIAALSACSSVDSYNEVDSLNSIEATGSAFTRELANQYRTYANAQLNDYFDYPDALHFARKGLAAAAGENVLPEPVTDWNLDEHHSKVLAEARSRMIVAFDYGAREAMPVESAQAQALFDCWIEVQEEYWTNESATVCQTDFQTVMQQIETQLIPVSPAQSDPMPQEIVALPPAPVEEALPLQSEVFDIDPQEPMKPENAMYLIFFNWDSSKVGSSALSILDAVVGEVNKTNPPVVRVVGHTDTSGTKAYNQRLALKRAKAAKEKLVERGVAANLIAMDAKGETDLLVPTPDGVREPANRRVNISFE